LAPQPGGWNDEDAGSGIDSAVPDTRLSPTAPPEARNGSAPVPETRIWQPPPPPPATEPDDEAAEEAAAPKPEPLPEPDSAPKAQPEPAPEPNLKAQPEPAPPPPSAPPPAPTPPPAAVASAPDTVVAARASGVIGVLEFDDGVRVDVDGPVIIGRAPSQVEEDRPARLVPVRGATRGLSRNHVRIDVGLQGPFVVDLGSRNGTSLRNPGRAPATMDPWMPYPLEPDAELVFAEIICTFRAADRDPR
jgi:outer membrane biosynthesis protein TonB